MQINKLLIDRVFNFNRVNAAPTLIGSSSSLSCSSLPRTATISWRPRAGSRSVNATTAKIAAGMAFVQAGITAAFVVVLIFEGNALTGGYGFGLYSLSDVIAIMGFALALLKGRLWAAYGLFAYGLLDWVAKAVQSGQVAWIVPVMLYGIGAISLSRSEHLAPVASELRWKRAVVFAAVWVAGDVLIGFLLGLFGLTRSGVSQTSAVALSQTCLPAIWGAAICYAAARRAVWPFETVLLIAILTSPIAIVDLLSTSGSPLLLLASIVSAIALSMIGWGLVILFPAAKLAMCSAPNRP